MPALRSTHVVDPKDAGIGRGKKPVIFVSWNDAQQYVTWLSNVTGRTYRLLSEAEWEYAARGGTNVTYSWGNDVGDLNANCKRCGSEWDAEQTAPVGSFAPNAFGLHDVHGNVWEWVEDCYHDDYEGSPPNGSAWTGDAIVCDRRVVRGGSWLSGDSFIRSASRHRYYRDITNPYVGIRIARTLGPMVATQYANPTQQDEKNYRNARGNSDKLLAYLNNCTICKFKTAAQEEINYHSAEEGIDLLKSYVRDCQVCEFKSSAQRQIVELERARQQEEEEAIYEAAHEDLDRLRSYLSNCKVCAFSREAEEEITRLEQAQASDKTFVPHQNRDIEGGDDQRINSVSLSSCELACKISSECVAFTFDRWNNACFLKSEIGRLRIDLRSITGVSVGLLTPENSDGPVIMQRYPGKMFPGNGYSSLANSAENCESTCQADSQCIAYSFLKDPRRCTLFSETGEYFSDKNSDSGGKLQPAR
jgi:hypothetical protein